MGTQPHEAQFLIKLKRFNFLLMSKNKFFSISYVSLTISFKYFGLLWTLMALGIYLLSQVVIVAGAGGRGSADEELETFSEGKQHLFLATFQCKELEAQRGSGEGLPTAGGREHRPLGLIIQVVGGMTLVGTSHIILIVDLCIYCYYLGVPL